MMSYRVGGLAKIFAKKYKDKATEQTEDSKRVDELLSKKYPPSDHQKVEGSEGKKSKSFRMSTENGDEAFNSDRKSPRGIKSVHVKNENSGLSFGDSGTVEVESEIQSEKKKNRKRKHEKSVTREETVGDSLARYEPLNKDLSQSVLQKGSDKGVSNPMLTSKKAQKKRRKAEKRALLRSAENQDKRLSISSSIDYAERVPCDFNSSKVNNKIDVVSVESEEEVSCLLIKRRKKAKKKNQLSQSMIANVGSDHDGDSPRISPSKIKKEPKYYIDEEMDTDFKSVLTNMNNANSISKKFRSKSEIALTSENEIVEPVDAHDNEAATEYHETDTGERNFSKQASLNRLKEELKKKAKKFREKKVGDVGNFSADSVEKEKRHMKRSDIPGISEKPRLMKFSARTEEEPPENGSNSEDELEEEEEDEEEESFPSKRKIPKSSKAAFKTEDHSFEDSPEKLERTLFFGNVPVSMKKKALKQIFQQYGDVENIRFRSFIPLKPTISKKVAEIRKECHSNVTSYRGYVVFKNVGDVEEALTLNGTVINGNHIRVDRVSHNDKGKTDDDRTVFVGSLPYNIDDESLWTAFSACGAVESIRVVRDKHTGLGKGFGFVMFKDASSIDAALELNGTELCGRYIRVKNHSRNQAKIDGSDRPVHESRKNFGSSRTGGKNFGSSPTGGKNFGSSPTGGKNFGSSLTGGEPSSSLQRHASNKKSFFQSLTEEKAVPEFTKNRPDTVKLMKRMKIFARRLDRKMKFKKMKRRRKMMARKKKVASMFQPFCDSISKITQ